MQTRKRAKSVSFGKKEKEHSEKEPVKEVHKVAHEEKVEVEEPKKPVEKTTEKAEVVERRTVHEKPQSEELSSTLPDATESEGESAPAETTAPAGDIAADNSAPSVSDEKESASDSHESAESEPQAPPSLSNEVPQPVETTPQPTVPPSAQPAQPSGSQEELSSTLPPSAFTIQSSDSEVPSQPVAGKKRFGAYFFVIAFIAFILGLAVIVAASYFGLINVPLPKVPSGVHMPAMLGSKPTPTSAPTATPAPTAVPVNLQQYSIAVLNGSGVTGEAAKLKTSLTSGGFKVDSTGNADNSNFTKTEISVKKSVSQAYLSKLEDELNKTYVVDTTVATSPDSDSADVTVTIGSSTAQ